MKELLNNLSGKDTVENNLHQAFQTTSNLQDGDVSADQLEELQSLRHEYDNQLYYKTSTVNVFGEFNNATYSQQHLLLRMEALAKKVIENND